MDIFNFFDRFYFNYYAVSDDKISVIFSNFFFPIKNFKFLLRNDLLFFKLQIPYKSIFINLFKQTAT